MGPRFEAVFDAPDLLPLVLLDVATLSSVGLLSVSAAWSVSDSAPSSGDSGLDLSLDLRNSSSEMQIKRERSWPQSFGLIFLKMNSVSDEVKVVGRAFTASTYRYTWRRESLAFEGGVILRMGLESYPTTLETSERNKLNKVSKPSNP